MASIFKPHWGESILSDSSQDFFKPERWSSLIKVKEDMLVIDCLFIQNNCSILSRDSDSLRFKQTMLFNRTAWKYLSRLLHRVIYFNVREAYLSLGPTFWWVLRTQLMTAYKCCWGSGNPSTLQLFVTTLWLSWMLPLSNQNNYRKSSFTSTLVSSPTTTSMGLFPTRLPRVGPTTLSRRWRRCWSSTITPRIDGWSTHTHPL